MRHPDNPAHQHQGAGLPQAFLLIGRFIAILYDAGAALQGFCNLILKVGFSYQFGIRNGIQPIQSIH